MAPAQVASEITASFKFGLRLNIIGNDGQNKFEVHIIISKDVANLGPKILIVQDATFAPTFNWHNSVISYPILYPKPPSICWYMSPGYGP